MDKDRAKQMQDKIINGVEQAYIKLVQEKQKANGTLVISIDGKIKTVNARDINTK